MSVTVSGQGLTIDQIRQVALGARVQLSTDPAVLARLEQSRAVIRSGVA